MTPTSFYHLAAHVAQHLKNHHGPLSKKHIRMMMKNVRCQTRPVWFATRIQIVIFSILEDCNACNFLMNRTSTNEHNVPVLPRMYHILCLGSTKQTIPSCRQTHLHRRLLNQWKLSQWFKKWSEKLRTAERWAKREKAQHTRPSSVAA